MKSTDRTLKGELEETIQQHGSKKVIIATRWEYVSKNVRPGNLIEDLSPMSMTPD